MSTNNSNEYVESIGEPKPRRCPKSEVHNDQDAAAVEMINDVLHNKDRIRQLELEIALIKHDTDETNMRLLEFILKNQLYGVVSINYRRLYDIVTR